MVHKPTHFVLSIISLLLYIIFLFPCGVRERIQKNLSIYRNLVQRQARLLLKRLRSLKRLQQRKFRRYCFSFFNYLSQYFEFLNLILQKSIHIFYGPIDVYQEGQEAAQLKIKKPGVVKKKDEKKKIDNDNDNEV